MKSFLCRIFGHIDLQLTSYLNYPMNPNWSELKCHFCREVIEKVYQK